MADVQLVEEQHLVVDAMEQLYALFVKGMVVLLRLDTAIIFLVLHVIRLADAKFVKVRGSAYVQIQISQDIHQAQTHSMELMEELFLPIALEAVVGLPLVLLRVLVLPRHHVGLAADVAELVLTQHRTLEEVYLHGWHITTTKEANAHIVVTIQVTIMTDALHVTYLDNA